MYASQLSMLPPVGVSAIVATVPTSSVSVDDESSICCVVRYYRALNNTLNHDIDGPALRCAIPLIGAMIYDLCCFVDGAPRQFERDTRVWKVSRAY